jgi:iron complex outermembrane receptor protein
MDSMRSSTISVAAAVAFALYGPAIYAQTAPDASANAAESGGALEEVVITAQKRTERLEDVPVSASVVSAQTLAAADIADLSDLNKLVPSVELNGTINGRVPTGVRGISSVSNEQTVGISSGVAINIDGVPVPSDSFDANNVAGIQNVEVLLGPQSTLGGRTAASGLINLTTRGPSDTLQGFATTTVTDDGEYRIEGFLSGPIAPRIDASLSAYKSTTPYPITNTALGEKTTQDVSGARLKLLFHVTDDFDITLMGHDELTQGKGFNFVYAYITPGNSILLGPAPGAPPFLSQAVLLPGIKPSWNNLDYASPVTGAGADHRDNDYSAILEYRLPGGYTITSTSAYQQEDQRQVQDLFAVDGYFFTELTGGHATFDNEQSQTTTVRQESEELKIVSPSDQNFSWLAGAFYSDVNVDELYLRTLPPAGLDDHVVPDTKTADLYARSTWKFLPTTSLVTGLRFNHDEISYQYNQYVTPPSSPPAWYSVGSSNSNTLVGDVSLKQQFSDNSMGYLSYARGYSPAAYNTSAVLTSNATMAPVGKESINSYELGTKGTYLNHTLTLNADIFDTIYTNYQIQSYAYAPGVLTPPLNLTSVGKAETKGVEVSTDWLATHTTRLDLSAAYIDAKFVNYTGAPCYGLQTAAEGCNSPAGASPSQNVSGDTMPNSPKLKFTFGAEQRVPLPTIPYQLVFNGTWTYRTSAQMLPDQNPYAIQGAFGLVNLSAAFQSTDGKYSATAFVNNVGNHHYFTDVEDFWSGPWGGNAVIGQPARDSVRYAGLRLSAAL